MICVEGFKVCWEQIDIRGQRLALINSVSHNKHLRKDIGIKSIRMSKFLKVLLSITMKFGVSYGTCQGTPSLCGVGVVLYLSHSHFFTLKYGAG